MFAHRVAVSVACALLLLVSADALAQESDEARDDAAKDSAATLAVTTLPTIAPEIHDAMQSRDFALAVKANNSALAKADTPDKDYLLYLKGLALTESNQLDESTQVFEQLENEFPKSEWVTRARFGRANVFVIRRQYIGAGKIYRAEAERLLSRQRKDELAGIYLEFADRYYDGIPADDPSQEKKPDFKQALTYYQEAVKLGPTIGLRQRVEFRIARCFEELDNHAEAITTYDRFLSEYGDKDPKSGESAPLETQAEARYRLGSVLLKAGQNSKARRTWQDLLSEFADRHDERGKELNEYLAKAEYRMAQTYGLPKPEAIGDLELGVALAERFLKNHPNHELAPTCELEIASGYLAHDRHQQAVERLQALIANEAYQDSDQVPIARRMIGQAYLAQQQFDRAIDAWQEFLEQYPTDPEWPGVQKWIVNTEYAKAEDARKSKRYDDARALWQTFLNKYPLDNRAAGILYQFGQMKFAVAAENHLDLVKAAIDQGDSPQSVRLDDDSRVLFEEAIADWRRVVSKYPDTDEASRASFMIGVTLEDRLERLKDALDSYNKVTGNHRSAAEKRIGRLTTPQLEIVTERKFRSDEKPRIKLVTRNLQDVTVKAYRVDMADYFRKMHLASGVETLDIALIDPDSQFKHTVEPYEQYRRIEGDVDIPVDGPGVTAVTVSSDKLEVTTMVVVSDIDVIVKSSRNELFLFAENVNTGRPVEGVSVLVSDGSDVFAEELTNEDGIVQRSDDELKSVRDLRIFAIHEGHVASTVNNMNGLDFAVGLTPRGYLYTDRPAYRAGQLVNIKGIVRWVDQDRFTFARGEKFKLDVYDARGRLIQSKDVALNGFGTISSNLILPETAPQGDYRVHLHRASSGSADTTGALSFETHFAVTEYRLEPVQVSIDFEKDVYFRGETVEGTIAVKYYYGTPLAGEKVQYSFGPDGETVTAKTDEEGKIKVALKTQRFSESQPLTINVQYPDRGLSSSKTVYLATRGFAVSVGSSREVFITGESFDTTLNVSDPAGNGVKTKLTVEVFQRTVVAGKQGERLVVTHEVTTDEDSGEARQTLEIEDGGMYLVRATGVDQFGNQVSGQKRLRISGDKDSVRLRILADKHAYEVGEEAEIRLHWREEPALALVTFEGASVLGYRLIQLEQGENAIPVPMESGFAPNFFLSVAVMQRNRFHWATSGFRVAQRLKVTIKPDKETLRPGEALNVAIDVTDPQGNPIQAELSLALVQTNLLSIFSDVQGAVDAFFGAGERKQSVRQMTSCTFKYQPSTRSVSQFLITEEDRRATLDREVQALAELDGLAGALRSAYQHSPTGAAVIMSDGAVVPNAADWMDSRSLRGVEQMLEDVQIDGIVSHDYRVQTLDVNGDGSIESDYGQWGALNTWSVLPQSGRRGRAGQASGSVSIGFDGMQGLPSTQMNLPLGGPSQLRRHSMMQQLGNGRDQLGANPSINPVMDYEMAYRLESGPKVTTVQQFREAMDQPVHQFFSINGLTGKGKFLVFNAQQGDEVERLEAEEGLQLLPGMAHAETAYWDPLIVTDDNGKATVVITMPDRSTAWRLRAKGIDGTSLAGESSVDVMTRKELFGDMKLPLAFTTGDKSEVPVEIHNSLDGARGIKVVFKATLGEKSTEQTKTIDVQGPGIHKLSFPIEIEAADTAEFKLTVDGGDDASDEITRSVEIHPYGFPVYDTASGTASQSTIALVRFDESIEALRPSLDILIGANVNRSLIESVLGGGFEPDDRCGFIPAGSLGRSVSDVIGGVALLSMVRDARNDDTPESQALAGRVNAAVAQLISAQRDDGGWNWGGRPEKGDADAYLSSRVMWALSIARRAGFAVANDPFSKGQAFLKSSFAKTQQWDLERQAILLHAMAESQCGDFAFGNRIYRERNRLSSSGLVYLALALSAMNHNEMAGDLLSLVKINSDPEKVRQQSRQRLAGVSPWMHSGIELRALYLLALEKVKPASTEAARLAKWLMAARVGSRWPVEKANGPTIASMANWQARNQDVSGKYAMTIFVNDNEIETFTVDPAKDGSRRIKIDPKWLETDKPQRINFDLEGRGTFSYSAVLTGFVPADKLKSTTQDWGVTRLYEPAQRMFDGRPVPRGFAVVDGSYKAFYNALTQLPVGNRGEVTLRPRRRTTTTRPGEHYDYLVLTEPIPAGCTVLDGSVRGQFERFEIGPGSITFYIGATRYLGEIQYSLVGYVPGNYRIAQSLLRSFYDPSQMAISEVKELAVLTSGAESADKYRLTPDELYHLGQRELAKANHDAAHGHLTELFSTWRLDAEEYKNVVQWLFRTSMAKNSDGEIVKYFEIIKEKYPAIELSFEDILNVARSYRELGEYERSYLVYRSTVQASFERESQVAGFLNARGEFVRSVQTMERLLDDYPAESYIATATYALAQEVYRRAASTQDDPKLKEQGLTRIHMINASIEMLDHFVSTWPTDPADDQASFALATALIDLDRYDSAIARCESYAQRYPDSRLLDSYWYMIGYSHFELEHHQEALKMCEKVAAAMFPVLETGGTRAADNKWEAVYIMGQVYHSLGKAADAIMQYTKVEQRFADAAEAIDFFSRKEIQMDEVTTIKPGDAKRLPLRFRNIPEVAIKVYRIDLMKFGLMQRNLDRITAINLAGIKPYHEETVKLGDGKDYRDRDRDVVLPLEKEGAYLVVCRGENLYTSGLVLVSPLALSVNEDVTSGRVRVTVKDTSDDSFVDDVHVKVIGSVNDEFVSGETDLRGLFIADDIKGTSTVIAVVDDDRYAFFRGTTALQGVVPQSLSNPDNAQDAAAEAAPQPPMAGKPTGKAQLRSNLFDTNGAFQMQQKGNIEELFNNDRSGIATEEAY